MKPHTKTDTSSPTITARRSARFLAVQTIYAMDINVFHNNVETIVSTIKNQKAFLKKLPYKANLDQDYYIEIVKGVEESLVDLDAAIEPYLATGWRLERLATVVRSILRAAACEMLKLRKTDYPIIIDEYLEIAKLLNHAGEVGFINKVLDAMAQTFGIAKKATDNESEDSTQLDNNAVQITIYNTLSRKLEAFEPMDPKLVKMYVCGPTVYDRPHLGNMRAAVVYDLLFRLLQACYPKVLYVRNITDVDDKIIAAANEGNEDIAALTQRITGYYHQDVAALACLPPTVEPKATEHIQEMIAMIQQLIKTGHAYHSQRHVLFSVASFAEYGRLARRSQEEMIAGARVEVAPYKRDPGDFVLWKPTKPGEEECSFDSPWGRGRPGWHIECSAMSKAHLGEEFDIHGGGADLMFPHHENEIAQSTCANEHKGFARFWVHNGFLTVGGEKMSKSLGNFHTARELLDTGISGVALRYFYLTTHYRKPLDYSEKAIRDAAHAVEKFRAVLAQGGDVGIGDGLEVLQALANDLNSSKALALLHEYAAKAAAGDKAALAQLWAGCALLGLDIMALEPAAAVEEDIPEAVSQLAAQRAEAKANKDWQAADALRAEIEVLGYRVKDMPGNKWELHKL